MYLTHYKTKNHSQYTEEEVLSMISTYNMCPDDASILARKDRVDSYDDLIDNLFFIKKRGMEKVKDMSRYIKTVESEKHGWRRRVVLKDDLA